MIKRELERERERERKVNWILTGTESKVWELKRRRTRGQCCTTILMLLTLPIKRKHLEHKRAWRVEMGGGGREKWWNIDMKSVQCSAIASLTLWIISNENDQSVKQKFRFAYLSFFFVWFCGFFFFIIFFFFFFFFSLFFSFMLLTFT